MLDFFHISTLTNYQKINCYMLTIFGIRSFLMLCSDLICISNTCNEISRILMWSYRNHLMGKCICASLLPYVNYGNCAVIDQQIVVCFKHATFEHQYKYALGSEDTNLKPKVYWHKLCSQEQWEYCSKCGRVSERWNGLEYTQICTVCNQLWHETSRLPRFQLLPVNGRSLWLCTISPLLGKMPCSNMYSTWHKVLICFFGHVTWTRFCCIPMNVLILFMCASHSFWIVWDISGVGIFMPAIKCSKYHTLSPETTYLTQV